MWSTAGHLRNGFLALQNVYETGSTVTKHVFVPAQAPGIDGVGVRYQKGKLQVTIFVIKLPFYFTAMYESCSRARE
jgi:hypothetical protein